MASSDPALQDAWLLRQMALSRWDNEGGAGACGPQDAAAPDESQDRAPPLTNAELVNLRMRVIALAPE